VPIYNSVFLCVLCGFLMVFGVCSLCMDFGKRRLRGCVCVNSGSGICRLAVSVERAAGLIAEMAVGAAAAGVVVAVSAPFRGATRTMA
jgi:hypothetical protein